MCWVRLYCLYKKEAEVAATADVSDEMQSSDRGEGEPKVAYILE